MASVRFFPLMPHSIVRRLSLVSIASAVLLLAACEGDDPRVAQSQYLGGVYGTGPVSTSAPRDSISYWDGDGVAGKPSIKISLGEQKAYFYKGGQLVGISQLSTGREGMGTSTGSFKPATRISPSIFASTDFACVAVRSSGSPVPAVVRPLIV